MSKKNKLILITLLLVVAFCILTISIIQIYAKYLSIASGNSSMTIANWNILVNNLNIKNHTDISANIVPVFPGNSHIASDIIAPTCEGYFDLQLDYSQVDVSFKYTITTIAAPDSSVSDLVATGYSINDGPIIGFENFNTPITDTILLNTTPRTKKIRIYILWNDNELTQTMSNASDTQATITEAPALMNVNIAFTQIID